MTRAISAIAVAIALSLLGAPPAHGSGGWIWPLRGEVITRFRNDGDPYAAGQHRGIDIAGRVGAPVVAAAAGIVRFAGSAGYSGLTVGVRTADGRFDTSYLHLSSISVRKGQRVAAGDRLGAVGTTGRRSAAQPHLHFGVRDAGSRHGYHDPLDFLPPPARPRPAPRLRPVPVGAPARPSPVPALQTWPVGVRLPEPRALPLPSPRRLPEPGPRPVPAPRPIPVPSPHGAPAHLRRHLPAHDRSPEAGPSSAPAAALRPTPVPKARDRKSPRGEAAPGPDVGWALACLGLLLAAALIGVRPGHGGAPRRLPARLGALLSPLTGRG